MALTVRAAISSLVSWGVEQLVDLLEFLVDGGCHLSSEALAGTLPVRIILQLIWVICLTYQHELAVQVLVYRAPVARVNVHLGQLDIGRLRQCILIIQLGVGRCDLVGRQVPHSIFVLVRERPGTMSTRDWLPVPEHCTKAVSLFVVWSREDVGLALLLLLGFLLHIETDGEAEDALGVE